MTVLDLPESYWLEKNALHTAREIASQPALWRQTAALLSQQKQELEGFLKTAAQQCTVILLTGAGTSAFVGRSLAPAFTRATGLPARAAATTDIVTHPHHYFGPGIVPLVISFARSGNSPESVATVQLADQLCPQCVHLIITCNAQGALAQAGSGHRRRVFTLPPAANDQGLAMTGSYTSMLLTGMLLTSADGQSWPALAQTLADAATGILQNDLSLIRSVARKDFRRAIFLGSGILSGTAAEAALKLQELTDGRIICQADTYLGLRHGPRAAVDETTLMVYFLNSDPYVLQYEKDLLHDMHTGGRRPLFSLGISPQPVPAEGLDAQINFSSNNSTIAADFLPVCSILPGQLLGLYKSLELGLRPDTPSESGAISRVVSGVTIYSIHDNHSMRGAAGENI